MEFKDLMHDYQILKLENEELKRQNEILKERIDIKIKWKIH